MASVYKRKKRASDGRLIESPTWSVECKTPSGFRRVPGFRDRKASEELGRKIERLSALRIAGERDAELDRWAAALPDKMQSRLARLGVLDTRTVASGESLASHVADWKADMLARGVTTQHAELSANRVMRVFDTSGITKWIQVSPSRVQATLCELLVDKHGGRPKTNPNRPRIALSGKSRKHYVGALKSFAQWMQKDGRASDNPLAHLSIGGSMEKRHERRALEPDELRFLLRVTGVGPHRYNMTGAARAVLYRLAAETGLRAGELRTLTRASFVLDDGEPSVILPGANTKNRQDANIALRLDTAADLRAHLSDMLPGAVAFTMPVKGHVAEMLKADLSDARVAWIGEAMTLDERAERERTSFLAYRDDAGRVCDFHSFRVTTATMLIAGGTDVRTAMDVMRHSTPTLTLGVYAKRLRGSERDAIANLPDLRSDPASETRQRATGTHGRAFGAFAISGTRNASDIGGGKGGGKGGRNADPCHTTVCANIPIDGDTGYSVETPDSLEKTRDAAMNKGNWARLDSNQRRCEPTGLQPVSFGHSDTRPVNCGEER